MKRAPEDAHGEDKEAFRAEVRRWAEKIRVKPSGVYVQRMTRKRASCSSKGRLCFASSLLKEPAPVREAAIVHELIHLIVPNHGKLFKSMLRAYLPGGEKTLSGE
jgi:predicted metal-dependent hydrolase